MFGIYYRVREQCCCERGCKRVGALRKFEVFLCQNFLLFYALLQLLSCKPEICFSGVFVLNSEGLSHLRASKDVKFDYHSLPYFVLKFFASGWYIKHPLSKQYKLFRMRGSIL